MKRLGILMALAVVTTACGQMASLQAPSRMATPQRLFALTTRTPADLVAKANEVFADLKDCTADVTTWTAKVPGDKDTVTYGEARMSFKKAHKDRLEVTKADDDPKKVGTVIAYTGGDSAQILLKKGIPLLGRLFTLKITDKKLLTTRGVRIDQMDLPAMIGRLNAKRATFDPTVREDAINGRKVLIVTAKGTFKGIDDDVTHEEIAFDAETGVPALDSAFVGQHPVLRLGVANLKPNVGLNDDLFVLTKDSTFARR
ncbi:MAG: hypothetical protein H7338_09650 [Candidatus Sericytochromatia bacterium]|nr:hypothetical protein [Candidatus Sericytochromatia bacterium]